MQAVMLAIWILGNPLEESRQTLNCCCNPLAEWMWPWGLCNRVLCIVPASRRLSNLHAACRSGLSSRCTRVDSEDTPPVRYREDTSNTWGVRRS